MGEWLSTRILVAVPSALQSHKSQVHVTWLSSILPSFPWSPGWVAANKMCIGLLRLCLLSSGFLSLPCGLLSLPCGQKAHFSQPYVMWVPLPGSGALVWGPDPSLGFQPQFSQGKTPATDISPELQPPPGGVGPYLFASPPFLLVLIWLLLSFLVIRVLFSLSPVGYSVWLFYNLVVIQVLSS